MSLISRDLNRVGEYVRKRADWYNDTPQDHIHNVNLSQGARVNPWEFSGENIGAGC